MQLKQKITSFFKKISRIPLWITIPVVSILLALVVIFIIFIQVKPVQFSYGGDTCAQQLTLFPNLSKLTDEKSGFSVSYKQVTKLGNIQLFSAQTCFTAKQAPSVGDTKLSVALYGGWFGKKTYKLTVSAPPAVSTNILSQPIVTTRSLVIPLSVSDSTFSYQLKTGDKTTVCLVKDTTIQCDIKSLNLLQGQSYNIKLVRIFDGKVVSILLDKTISTIKATNVTGSSIAQDEVIFDSTKTFTFDFDKNVVKSTIILEKVSSNKHTPVAVTATYDGKRITVSSKTDFERGTSYQFTIDQLEAVDGSTLIAPYKLGFMMSNGPVVIGVNVDTYGIALTKTIVLTFDQTLSSSQDIANFVSTSGIPTTISRADNQVFITYGGAPMCTDLSIQIRSGLQSNYGIVQNNTWSFSTRTVCHTISTIGYSVEGRSINAYIFGSGSQTILYTGSIHGNELSAKYLMNAWIDELELNAGNIPANKTLIVIPSLNPDGNAANTRNNADNVDLNRNFPVSDWQTDIYSPTNQLIPGGGGPTPLSEPESQAIAAYTLQLMPKLTMSFHSSAGYAIGNQYGDSAALANTYAQLAGYSDMTGDPDAFSYPITGTYDDWMREECGLTSVLVELSSNTSSQFDRNKDALWTMAGY